MKRKRDRLIARVQNRQLARKLDASINEALGNGQRPEDVLSGLNSESLRLLLTFYCLFPKPTRKERYDRLVDYYRTGN